MPCHKAAIKLTLQDGRQVNKDPKRPGTGHGFLFCPYPLMEQEEILHPWKKLPIDPYLRGQNAHAKK